MPSSPRMLLLCHICTYQSIFRKGCLTYHAARKAEFKPFNQSYSQLTIFISVIETMSHTAEVGSSTVRGAPKREGKTAYQVHKTSKF